MSNLRQSTVACVLLLLALGSPARADALGAAENDEGDTAPHQVGHASHGDRVCGPRCVQFVLQRCGKPHVDLVDLVREIQWPDIEAGASLGALGRALEARGLHTAAIKLEPEALLHWPEPAIVHVRPANSQGDHFLVWLGSPGRHEVQVWDGLLGVRTDSLREHLATRTGPVLLVSRSSIADPASAARMPWNTVPILLALVALLVCAGYFARVLRRRHCAHARLPALVSRLEPRSP
jgi:ABC-type bacteriocin/lantibiotic exporter with double-glycine peptidase domain